jgi:hypothetical protein
VAGPFNLGDVNVRSALQVDRTTAALKVVTDPLPTILDGIPLDVRDVRVTIDKSDFIVNPTSCSPKSVRGEIESTSGATASVSTRFQVGDCGDLSLAPRISLSVGAKRRTGSGASTPFTTVIRQSPGQSNLRTVSVSLPTTLNARLPVVNNACTLQQFHAGRCAASRAGTAVAYTPLLKDPLRGGAYFVKNGRPLPDLMIALRGQVSLDLDGKVSIPGGTHLATRFDTIPDAPITKFVLRLVAGKHGPIGAAANLCTAKSQRAKAQVRVRGQNGKLVNLDQRLHIIGCAKHHPARHRKSKR